MTTNKLTEVEKQALVKQEIARWFDEYHAALMQLKATAQAQNIPFEVHFFVKSQAERFPKHAKAVPSRPRLKCLVFFTPYYLNTIHNLIESFHQQATDIVQRYELKKHPKLLEKPLLMQDVISVNFTKNPAISILKVQPAQTIEWFEHQLKLLQEQCNAPIENQQGLQEIHLLNDAMERLKQFELHNDGSQILKRFYQSGFSYRATLRFANHQKKVLSLNEFLFVAGHADQLPNYGDSTQLPYSRKKRADVILKSDRNIVAETPNPLHYYFWEYAKDKNT